MQNKIQKLGLERVVLGLVGQGKNHREIAKALKGLGHEVTESQVYGFTSKISPDERNRLLQENKAADIASMEELEAVATRVLKKMEALLDDSISEGTEKFMAISSFSNQLGAWLDRLVKLRAKQPDKITIQVQYIINNFQTVFSTIQDVLLSNDDWAEAYAAIDERLKERLGPNWGRVDLTQPSQVAALEPGPAPMKAPEPDGDLSAGKISPAKKKPANQVGHPEENLEWISRKEEKKRIKKKDGGKHGSKKGKTGKRRTAKDGKAARSVAARAMPKVQGPHDHKA